VTEIARTVAPVMRKNSASESGLVHLRTLLGLALCSAGTFFGLAGFAAPPGQWTIVPSPSPSALYNYLIKVTCVSANDCWAVGSYWNSTNDQALIEHYDGTSWSVVASPSPGPTNGSYLVAITCLNASACWAVGSYSLASTGTIGFGNTPIGELPLVEYYDGTAWSIVTSPPGPPNTTLRGVSCLSATDCWAVGHSGAEVIETFVEHYDGTVWSIVPSPNPPSPNASLYAVSCPSSVDCWAVGEFFNTVPATCGDSQTVSTESLVEHYDGTSWSIVNAPYDPCKLNLLDKIACVSGADCWAVGTKSTDTSSSSTLIQHYDGAAWAIIDSPNTDPVLLNYLYGVTCASAGDCWAVGLHDIGGTVYRPMIQHYDGAVWSVLDMPVVDGTYRLDDVTCVSGNDCWAVGIDDHGHTLIEHYTVPVTLNAVVSRKDHGGAGTFDLDLPIAGNPGIECRTGGANGDHTLVFSFSNPLNAVSGITATATTSGGTQTLPTPAGNIGTNAREYFVNLTGVPNASHVNVTLNRVTDSANNVGDVSARMDVLLGDVNSTGRSDAGDVTAVRNKTVSIPDQQTFRYDVNTSGRIDAGDVTATRNATVTVLP
jgi:hypothetical protein